VTAWEGVTMTSSREAELHRLEERLSYRFRDVSLLDRALTHVSRAHEDPRRLTPHNEPLEFLGDSILGFVVAVMLHRREPEGGEGAKSRLKAHLVSAASLAHRAAALGLPDYLRLGRGEEKTGGRAKTALWGNAYEALVAVLYLDGGVEAVQRFVEAEFGPELEALEGQAVQDFKTRLQEILQSEGRLPPTYVVIEEMGPSHRRQFRVQCVIDGEAVAEGLGHSKKEAQQEAACRALGALPERGLTSGPE
jgi:ribonuclease III